MNKKVLSASLFLLLILSSCATVNNSNPIPKAVNNFLIEKEIDFTSCELSDLSDLSEFAENRRYYLVSASPDQLWKAYISADPLLVWRGNTVNFGVMWDPYFSKMYTCFDLVPPFNLGQIYVVDLMVAGIYNIPAAFKISKMDSVKKNIEFIYLKKNTSNGVQRIYFYTIPGRIDQTLIYHHSHFSSGNDFRDSLYPVFHEQLIDDFHKNIFKLNSFEFEIMNLKEYKKWRTMQPAIEN